MSRLEMMKWEMEEVFLFKNSFYSPTCYVKMKGLLIGRAECGVSNKIPSENPLKSP